VSTRFTAQQKVHQYTFAQLAADRPEVDIGVIIAHLTDTIQGDAIGIGFLDPVRPCIVAVLGA